MATKPENCDCPDEKLKDWCVKDCKHCFHSNLPEDESDLDKSPRNPEQIAVLLKSLAVIKINSAIPYKQVTWKDCPMVCPCDHCFEKTCTPKKPCDKLWAFIAARGDWVMAENRKLEEKYGPSREIQVMLNCPRKGTELEGSCKDCTVKGCYVGNVSIGGKPTQ